MQAFIGKSFQGDDHIWFYTGLPVTALQMTALEEKTVRMVY